MGNLTNNGAQLTRAFQPTEQLGGSLTSLGNPGYHQTSDTPPREFVMSVRHAFGSR